MAKTKEELVKLKEECESFNSKLKELSEDEMKEVTGGNDIIWLFEKSFDTYQASKQQGSIQEVIGGWAIEEHSK